MPEIYRLTDPLLQVQVCAWQADGHEQDILQTCDISWQAMPPVGSLRKQQEREAARCAAVALLRGSSPCMRLMKTPAGKPIIENDNRHLSLTHSKGWGAAALGVDPVGVDLEWIDWKRSMLPAERFLNPDEYISLGRSNKPKLLYYLFWSIKEGLYKVVNQHVGYGISFRRHLAIRLRFDPDRHLEGLADVAVQHPHLQWQGRWHAVRLASFWLTWGTFRQQ